MHNIDSECQQFPACGYGLIGLCCSSCLLGPCRISPFEKESQKGRCGDNADLMVAKHLLRLVRNETSEGLSDLYETLQEVRSSAVASDQSADSGRVLSSLFLENEKKNVLSKLFPINIFHNIYSKILSNKAWGQLLCKPVVETGDMTHDVRSILFIAFELSLLESAIAHLCKDIKGGDTRKERDGDVEKALTQIEHTTFSHITLCCGDMDAKNIPCRGTTEQCSGKPGLDLEIISLSQVDSVPVLMREMSLRQLRLPDPGKLDGIFSSKRLAPILASLACGLTLTSIPGLPVHGSSIVEKFMCEELRDISESVYVQTAKGEILNSLNRNTGTRG